MTAKRIVYITALTCTVASVGSWLGCKRSEGSTQLSPTGVTSPPVVLSPTSSVATASSKTYVAYEYKTLEKVEPTDPKQVMQQLREQLVQFQQDGWQVASISKPLPQPDGTVYRKYEIRRPKP